MNKKRFVLTVDLYIYADSEEEAKKTAKVCIDKLKETDDNKASIISLYEQNWGTLTNRELHYDNEGK